jgi:hypothetical protein
MNFAELDKEVLLALREILGRDDLEDSDVLEWRTAAFEPGSDDEAVVHLFNLGIWAAVPVEFGRDCDA